MLPLSIYCMILTVEGWRLVPPLVHNNLLCLCYVWQQMVSITPLHKFVNLNPVHTHPPDPRPHSQQWLCRLEAFESVTRVCCGSENRMCMWWRGRGRARQLVPSVVEALEKSQNMILRTVELGLLCPADCAACTVHNMCSIYITASFTPTWG